MKNIYFFIAFLASTVLYGQAVPPMNESCHNDMSFWENFNGVCFQALELRSVARLDGAITDSLYVRGANSYGTFKTIPPLRTNFSVTTTGSGAASYSSSTGVFNIPTPKVSVPYTGTTDVSGVYSITYPVAYSSTPNVQVAIVTSDPSDVVMLTSSSTTGCSFTVQRRVDVLGVLPSFTVQSGVTVNALVTPY